MLLMLLQSLPGNLALIKDADAKRLDARLGEIPKLSTVAANLLQYGSKRPLNTKIVKLDFGNQLSFDFEGRGYHKAIV